MPSLSSISLSSSILLCGHLSAKCTAPPHRPSASQQHYKTDRIRFITGTVARICSWTLLFLSIYHACVTLLYWQPDDSHLRMICPHPENLSESLFSWAPVVTISIVAIAVGAFVRLSAYGGLGRNFTFYLSSPDRLVTDGVYRYVQHPSYTGLVLLILGSVGLFCRWDGAAGACWMESWMLERVAGSGMPLVVISGSVGMMMIGVRVRDEERMLKEKFGRVWERWHTRTARFVPGIW
ncbi:methyltransferase family protein [Aspergillus clavatus NRRL 1]|uniref:Prenyl cysteine carboxyl methyltransferase, putative n=1 Tax=Aspergillus clavatus (strain ATCC 1007 / CBS 513.65 / DSM 816 / NCTC 3887 / NRRL 1 / QM 1276 / 107) TaxID=344612 RepID=A1C7A5_ASPCL|nr:prenyl cysteine carboxyl methyltransferase, putative [Aspergillus clavatus NRRL 1]EAW14276.1 prenyl cysteine carboxyl methyltransferase, putative [Aspergillus clavatus NRRL 1]